MDAVKGGQFSFIFSRYMCLRIKYIEYHFKFKALLKLDFFQFHFFPLKIRRIQIFEMSLLIALLNLSRPSQRILGVIINPKAIAESEYLRWVDSSRLYQISGVIFILYLNSVFALTQTLSMTLSFCMSHF